MSSLVLFLHACCELHWNPFLCFFLCLFHSSSPFPHHWLISTQPVKVKRKKSFNLSRKFPFYKSKENIVQELETEREYERDEGSDSVLHASSCHCHSPWRRLLIGSWPFCEGPLWPLSCSEGDLSTSHRCEAALTLKRCARTSISVKAV